MVLDYVSLELSVYAVYGTADWRHCRRKLLYCEAVCLCAPCIGSAEKNAFGSVSTGVCSVVEGEGKRTAAF